MEDINTIIVIVVLLFCSACFSGAETAFFSLDRNQKKKLSGLKGRAVPHKLISKPNYLLVTLLFGNMLVNIFLSNMTEGLFHYASFLKGYGENTIIVFSIICATFVLLLFGEVLPKVVAINKPLPIIKFTSPFIYVISIVIHPFKIGLFYITKGVKSLLKQSGEKESITDDELSAVVNVGFKEGFIDRDEVTLIKNVLKFAKNEVNSVMTPRTKLFALDINLSVDKFVYEAKKAGYSKVPVYDQSRDNIKGIIYMRDILSIIRGEGGKPDTLEKFVKDVLYVTEAKPLLSLLQDFKSKRIKVAVVIDEYGGTAGIVTLDDLIHRITGRFFEEDTLDYGRKVTKLPGSYFLCDGDASLEEVHRVTGIELVDEEQETIAGYLTRMMDKIPRTGDKYNVGNILFKITKSDGKKIEKVVIKLKKTFKKEKGSRS
jgi:putative hemolysin